MYIYIHIYCSSDHHQCMLIPCNAAVDLLFSSPLAHVSMHDMLFGADAAQRAASLQLVHSESETSVCVCVCVCLYSDFA
jgi:hypothetical protein